MAKAVSLQVSENIHAMAEETQSSDRFIDPVMREVWRIKDELARKFDYDIHRIAENARARQALSGHRIVTEPLPKPSPSE